MITKIDLYLKPVLSDQAPVVFVGVPGKVESHKLEHEKHIHLEFDAAVGWLEINFNNKPEHDINMAVIIDRIEFFGITDPRFVWQGVYTPKYPEPWYSQQKEKPPEQLPQQNYMGWNGRWRLDFDVPVFTWMHRTLDLGWLYQ